jgi:asparagine synthase (glutamine-hydrolysing)
MCSIFGAYCLKPTAKIHQDFASQAMKLMRHRGPDAEKFELIDNCCLLGHQRLSIIDTSSNANMPMHTEKSIISFNGEIYNYLELKETLKSYNNFLTTSDTEVLQRGIEREGIDFLHKTNGMFSIAFYNKKNKQLLLARDRFGVKPLYYFLQDDVLYFTSEIKPLISIKRKPEKNINTYNSFIIDTATDYNEETFIKDIFQIPAGHYLEINNEKLSTKKWYHDNDFDFDRNIFASKSKTVEFTEELLTNAIAIRLRSDVPLCITLSGGLDSTTIYTLINENLPNDIAAYTFKHPEKNIDESSFAEKLARSYGKKVNIVTTDEQLGIEKMLEALNYLEFPNWSVAIIAYMEIYRKLAQDGFKVVIEGHGSDEQLGGYPYMIESASYEYLKKLKILKAIEAINVYRKTNKWDNFDTAMPEVHNLAISIWRRGKNDQNFKKSLSEATNEAIKYRILPIVLRTFDRLTMRSSMESRSPFMDYRVVEFFRSMPTHYKISSIGSKAILREILKKYKKEVIYKNQQKQGFTLGLLNFYNNSRNKIYIKNQIEKLNMSEFPELKNNALSSVSEKEVEINQIDKIWKALSLSITNEKYGL